MATPRRQNPLGSQGVHTPINGEPKTDLIQLITRTESLSGEGDLAAESPRRWGSYTLRGRSLVMR